MFLGWKVARKLLNWAKIVLLTPTQQDGNVKILALTCLLFVMGSNPAMKTPQTKNKAVIFFRRRAVILGKLKNTQNVHIRINVCCILIQNAQMRPRVRILVH